MGEAVRGICDTINNLKHNNKRALLTAIDFKKAFDSVNFKFMEGVLKIFGFGERMIKMVNMLLYNFKAHTLHAGNISQSFRIGRGCRQGDPIASLIFVACIEMLLTRIRWDKEIIPIKITHRSTEIYGGQNRTMDKKAEAFADDCSLLTELDMKTQEKLVETLKKFSTLSGLEINKAKTQTMIIGSEVHKGQTADTIFEKVQQVEVLGVIITGDLEGMNVNIERKLAKMEKIMKSWSYRTLSPFGRNTVVKSLVLPQITMLASLLPCMNKSIVHKVDIMVQDFLWGRHEKKKLIKVKKVRSWLREENGGMNVMDTETFWQSMKIGWLRRALQGKSFLMEILDRDIQDATGQKSTGIIQILTTKGPEYILKVGNLLKNPFWKLALKNTRALTMAFYSVHKRYRGEAIFWDNKWPVQGVTPSNTSVLLKSYDTVSELSAVNMDMVGLSKTEKDHISAARSLLLPESQEHYSLPAHRGLSRALSWTVKGSSHWYKWLRNRENEAGLTGETEEQWNAAMGRNIKISLSFWRSHYTRLKDIKWNGSIKLAEMLIGMRRQTMRRDLKKMKITETDTCRLCESPTIQETECHIYSECGTSVAFWEQLEGWARSKELHLSGSRITRCLGSAGFPMLSPTNILLTYGRKEIYASIQESRKPDYRMALRSILKDEWPLLHYCKQPGNKSKINLMTTLISESEEIW